MIVLHPGSQFPSNLRLFSCGTRYVHVFPKSYFMSISVHTLLLHMSRDNSASWIDGDMECGYVIVHGAKARPSRLRHEMGYWAAWLACQLNCGSGTVRRLWGSWIEVRSTLLVILPFFFSHIFFTSTSVPSGIVTSVLYRYVPRFHQLIDSLYSGTSYGYQGNN